MGGTSTDVCLIRGGVPEPAPSRVVAGYPIRLPALDVHTIGAGGGSIARLDAGGALTVGPHSAGAVPGPACYGRGGTEPTVTDADLVLGRLDAAATFPDLGHLDPGAARACAAPCRRRRGRGRRGRRRRDGAGRARGQRRAGRRPPHGRARWPSAARGRSTPARSPTGSGSRPSSCRPAPACSPRWGCSPPRAARAGPQLGDPRRPHRPRRGAATCWPPTRRRGSGLGATVDTALDCRYAGQSHELTVPTVADFPAEHQRRNGYVRPDVPVEVVAYRARATLPALPLAVEDLAAPADPP